MEGNSIFVMHFPSSHHMDNGCLSSYSYFLGKVMKKKIIILSFIICLLFAFFYYENHHLVVSNYLYSSDKIGSGLEGFKIIQISDFHNARFGRANDKLIEKIKNQEPDIIVITGDIVDSNHTNIDVAIQFVNHITEICPVYYVTGNHEHWLSADEYDLLMGELNDAGVVVLNNESTKITRDRSSFALIGLDDNSLTGDTLKELVEQEKKKTLKVVLAHEPQYLYEYSEAKADLVLSGHAHGGQFRLPFIGGVVAPDQGFNPPYTEGKIKKGFTQMIVSRGLGNSIIPVRLFNDPEIVAITLTSNGKQSIHSTCMIDDVIEVKNRNYECSYEGVKHDFILDLPATTKDAPLVLMLHGYGESAEGFKTKSAFEKDANKLGYAVCYVTGAPNPEDSTSSNGWNSGIGISSNEDVDFLCGLSNYLCDTYGFDPDRVYVVGFSNGAFMTHRLALEASDTFAAVVSVAGMMPESIWDNKPEKLEIGVFQITGQKDDVVPKFSDGSAKYSKAPAIEDVIDYYATANNLMTDDVDTIGNNSILTKFSSPDSNYQVWNLFIPGGRHSWPDEKITGINVNQLILEYLSTQ